MLLFRKCNIWIIIICLLFCAGCFESNHSLSGYIEGEYTYISSSVAGILFKLHVVRGQQIKKNDLLYSLDPDPEKSKIVMSESNVLDLIDQVAFAKKQLERQKELYYKNASSKVNLDQAQVNFYSKSQQLAFNKAQLAADRWMLKQKNQIAPVTGKIFDVFYRIGENVPANHPVLAILTPENIKVLFYISEKKLHAIKIGQKIKFSCDGCDGKTEATIQYISPEAEYTPPVIYSKDTRDKLVYLVRADIPASISNDFHPGQPVNVYLSS